MDSAPALQPTARSWRLAHLDNLKAGLVAWIIGGHALLGYSTMGGWEYAEIKEVTFRPDVELPLTVVFGPSGLLVIGTFFFIAGLFVPRSLARRGPRRFVRDRMLRLGVPYLAFALLLWPLTLWLAYQASGHPSSYPWVFAQGGTLNDGPLWFVAVLLIFSLAYAATVSAGFAGFADPGPAAPSGPSAQAGSPARVRWSLRSKHLVALAAGVTVVTFVVRLWLPARSTQTWDLHLWQWPQCVAMFGLGIAGASSGLAEQIPGKLRRACGLATLALLVVLPLVAVVAGVSEPGQDIEPFLGGWRWQALVTATVEGILVVAGSVWLLGTAQRRLTSHGRLASACARGAYAAFILQGPVLLALAVAARPLAAPAEVKAFLVAAAGVAGSFWLGWLLVTRTPLGRLLSSAGWRASRP